MTTKFIHLRDEERHGPLGLFTRDSQFGGATIAYDIVTNNDGTPEKIVYAVAVCDEKDRYNKQRGRKVAEGRLLCKRGNRVHVITALPDQKIIEQVMNDAHDRFTAGGIAGLL